VAVASDPQAQDLSEEIFPTVANCVLEFCGASSVPWVAMGDSLNRSRTDRPSVTRGPSAAGLSACCARRSPCLVTRLQTASLREWKLPPVSPTGPVPGGRARDEISGSADTVGARSVPPAGTTPPGGSKLRAAHGWQHAASPAETEKRSPPCGARYHGTFRTKWTASDPGAKGRAPHWCTSRKGGPLPGRVDPLRYPAGGGGRLC